MYPVRSVVERCGKFSCALIFLAVCCHAHAGGPNDGVTESGASDAAVPETQAPAHLGFNAPEPGGASCPEPAGCATSSHRLSDYLLGFKKYFSTDRLLSRLGFFGYNATPSTAGSDGLDMHGTPPAQAGGAAPERMAGYMLNLNLPSFQTQGTVDAHYGWGGFTYVTRTQDPLRQGLTTRGVKYALYVEDCTRLEGLYGRSAGLDRFGFGLAQDNWSVALAGGAGMAVQVGYSIPLGRSGGAACSTEPRASHAFGPNAWLDQ